MAVNANFFQHLYLILLAQIISLCCANDILGCGGFVKSHVSLDFSKIEIGLYTKEGSLKERTECAPTNGYYFLPLYEKGEYVLKVHPPPGWSFEPSQVTLVVDGTTDQCSSGQDINFAFNGFGITGRVITAGQTQGPSGISVQLVDDKGEKRNTVTTVGGDFHFTPVIPGKYTLKASHSRWKLEPAQAVVQVKEGNTALPVGVLAVKGYDVKGSVMSYGNPISGLYVLLYSKEENPKFRVEGCKTALLQGVPDSPICHSITDSSGEFNFGLVPAGEYKLWALAKSPGQTTVTYNVKPESVPFSVLHDSLYIKNAFEVTGFTVVGSVLTHAGGKGISGARVLLDGRPAGTSDGGGRFTLPSLQPGVYTLGFQHEQCEFDEVQVKVTPAGPTNVPTGVAARWRTCGSVTPADARAVTLTAERGSAVTTVHVSPQTEGKWCTYLPPGVYTARVEVSEQEQRDGLQFYPVQQRVSVGHGPAWGAAFSQLKARLAGRVACAPPAACRGLRLSLRPLSADGGYVGQPLTTLAQDGEYTFEEVLPGSVEISVPQERLCWQEARHNVAVTQEVATVPTFEHVGYVLRLHCSHAVEVEYASEESQGVVQAAAGLSRQCVPHAARYTLTPRGCHRFRPPTATVDTGAAQLATVHFVAVAHAVVIRVVSAEPAADVVLRVGSQRVGPLTPRAQPSGHVYEHTLYMAPGEIAVVSAESSSLLFQPAEPQQVVGVAECQPHALTLRARRGLTLAGRLRPPVAAVTLALAEGDDVIQTQVTTEEGTYSFGPLDATKHYTITGEKESYVFSEPDANGDITAHKLAEITVQLVDDADDSPLQGALVSVSGGTFRRNVALGESGRLRLPALSPGEYYVKPNMKEYRFRPSHSIVRVDEGRAHHLTLRGVRVAWSCVGSVVSLGGVGWPAAVLLAAPAPASASASASAPACAVEEATADVNGAFRIRGLLPNCVYTLQLKESTTPELQGLKLAKAPPTLEVKDNKDIENVRLIAIQPHQITDASVLVYTPHIEHYRTLRLTLALEATPHTPVYSTKLDAAGFNQYLNPGLMYVLPRLPADNKTYVLQLESTLSKSTHTYGDEVYYFNSDGRYKSFTIEFLPKVKSSEQELRQTSLLVVPLLVVVVVAYVQREAVAARAAGLAGALAGGLAGGRAPQRARARDRADLLDRASIDHILHTLNAPAKKAPKKKAQ